MAATVDRVPILKLKIKIGDMRIEAKPVTHSSDFEQSFCMRNCVKTSQPNAKKLMPPQSLEGQKVKRQKTGESVKPSHISRSDLHSSDFGQNFSMRNCVKTSQPNAKKRMPPAKKRMAPQSLEGQKVKRQKTGESVKPSYISRSELHSEGAVSCLDEEHSCAVSQLTPLAADGAFAKGYETPVLDVQMSPRRALRVAMLKSRFADTISKAQQNILLAHGDKVNPLKMQQEKDTLKRKQLEEKAKIEAQIKAAEAASLLKARDELNLQIQKKRGAARLALQQMEKNVEIEDNHKSLKDLALLSGFTSSDYHLSFRNLSDLVFRKWGLSIADKYFVDDDDIEYFEGEIL